MGCMIKSPIISVTGSDVSCNGVGTNVAGLCLQNESRVREEMRLFFFLTKNYELIWFSITSSCIGCHLWWNVHVWKATIGWESCAARTRVTLRMVWCQRWRSVTSCATQPRYHAQRAASIPLVMIEQGMLGIEVVCNISICKHNDG